MCTCVFMLVLCLAGVQCAAAELIWFSIASSPGPKRGLGTRLGFPLTALLVGIGIGSKWVVMGETELS